MHDEPTIPSPSEEKGPPPSIELPRVRQLADVPVFNCHVYLAPPDERGLIHVRAAALAEVVATGSNERDALRNIVALFKQVVGRHLAAKEPIPWLDPPSPIEPNEKPRWVPVHF